MKNLISPLLFLTIIILIILLISKQVENKFITTIYQQEIDNKQEQIDMITDSHEIALELLIEKDEIINKQHKIINTNNSNQIYLGEYTVTAYCPCEICCGKWANLRDKDEEGNDLVYGASGELLISNKSVASNLPFGSVLVIDNKEYIVSDRTSDWVAEKYQDKIIDIYFDTHEEAVKFAKQIKDVYIKQSIVGGENNE